MPDEDMQRQNGTVDIEERMQASIIGYVLSEYPDTLTEPELLLRFTQGIEEPRPQDAGAVAQAIADLAGDGLIHRESGRVHPSRAVQRYHALTTGD